MTTPTTLTCTATRHGTSAAYKRAGCRCPEARTAETARKAKYDRNRENTTRSSVLAGHVIAGYPPFYADPRRNCADINPDLMFPTTTKQVPAALEVCDGCPFTQDCADWAIRTRQIYGVYGGTTQTARRRIIAKLIEDEKAAA